MMRKDPTSFWKSGHIGTLLAAFLYTESSFLAWIILGPLSLFLERSLGVGRAEAALLVALPILTGTILHLPLGLLVDRLGARTVAVLAQALTLLGLLWLWQGAIGLNEVRGAALLLGVAGASFAVAMPMVSAWYPPEHQGKALGLTALGGSGTLLAALAAPPLAEILGWQAVAGLAMLPVAMGLASCLLLAREAPEPRLSRPLGHYLYVLRYRDTMWFCFFYALTFGGVVSLAASLVGYFHELYGLSPARAGQLTALTVFGAALFRPLGGWLADRHGGIRAIQAAFVLTCAAMVLLALLPSSQAPPAVAIILAASMAFGCGNGAIFQLISVRYFRQMGVVIGLVGTAGGLG
ncbi:MAG: MFS transporter, partial [Rhodospirillales bacterium]|nr:MFS transporter [Rhodospirillales bacterium]